MHDELSSIRLLGKRKERGETRDNEEGEVLGDMGGRDLQSLESKVREVQTVLSTPAAFREAFCQH